MKLPDAAQIVRDGTVDIAEACERTGLGRTFLYSLMDKGVLRFCKLGRRRLIPLAELNRVLADAVQNGRSSECPGN
jgi:excisionase family DNA binding protein